MFRRFGWCLAVAVGLGASSAAAFPWMVKHDYQSCAVCHVDPSGAGQLTPYGRAQSDVLLRWKLKKPTAEEAQEPSPTTRFLWFLDLPEVLNLSGNFRGGALIPIGNQVRPLFMAADLYGTVKVDRFVFHATTGVGLRNVGPAAILPACGGDTPCNAQWVAREFWAGATFADESVMVRAASPVSVDVADDRIDGAMMNLAVQRLRAKHVDGFDLSMPLLSLSPAELCARSVRGLILLRPRSDGKTEQIEVNPLLAAAAPVVA